MSSESGIELSSEAPGRAVHHADRDYDHAMSTSLVSILTPSLNQGRWLERNLDSVSNQTYKNLEHIVSDGGSKDESGEVLSRADENVVWWSEMDKGQTHALNLAYRRSRGDFIGWLNADDAYFRRDIVQRVVDVFLSQPDVDVVYGHCAIVNADDMLLHFRWAPRFSDRLLLTNNFIYQPTVFMRRAALRDDYLVDESFQYTMDRELWLRLSSEGRRFFRINDVLAVDREHATRKSYTGRPQMYSERARVDDIYGAPRGRLVNVRRYSRNLLFRASGAVLVRRLKGGDHLPFSGDGIWQVLWRQIAVRRRRMPFGA